MLRLAARRLWTRRLQALAPLVALLAATLGFQAVLVSARSTQSHVQGVIAASWNPPYDLLVRPPSLVTGLKPGDHLMQPNYLESASGGISMAQVQAVRTVPGVAVAAPLGVVAVDYLWGQEYSIDLRSLPRSGNLTVYRITTALNTDAAASTIRGTDFAVVAGTQPPFMAARFGIGRAPMNLDGSLVDCKISCYGAPSTFPRQANNAAWSYREPWAANRYVFETLLSVPVVAVDPAAENALVGLNQCVISGRDLTAVDGLSSPGSAATALGGGTEADPTRIPVMLNTKPGFDETIQANLEASTAAGVQLAPSLRHLALEGGTIHPYLELPTPLLNTLTYQPAATVRTSLDDVWSSGGFTSGSLLASAVDYSSAAVSAIRYSGLFPSLVAQPAPVSDVSYNGNAILFQGSPVLGTADEGMDAPFRLAQTLTQNTLGVAKEPWHAFTVIGKYDPQCISSKDSLARSGYDIYAGATTTESNGSQLKPNGSITNFVAPMPLVMTNLAGGQFFSDPQRFAAGRGNAFLSVIRVKVSGTEQAGITSQQRLERVAAEIHRRTGLSVDIMKGSSSQPVSIGVPRGYFGRPATTVQQNWLKESVAISFFKAISSTTVVMSVVVAVVAALLTMQTTYATVRRRRGELVLLRAIGWPSWRVALLMELEVVALGVLVALVAVLVAGFIILVNHPGGGVELGVLLAAPAAVVLTAVAGAGPAFIASRTQPLAALRGPGRMRRHRRRLIRGPFSLGIREALTTWRWQTLLGALATAVGALFLGAVLAIVHDFHVSLDSTALAQQLSNEVGPFDVLLGVLAVALGATTAVSVVLVATRERLPHFATLRALGWSRVRVAQVVAGQALAVGLLGGVLGVIALTVVANRVKTGIALTWSSQLSPLVLGVATGVVAAGGAVRLVYRRVIVTVLRVG